MTPGGGTPTGTIQFEVDGTDYGDPVSMSGGSASLTTAATELTAGSHIITAKYSGDSNLAASDGSQTETVNQAVLTVSGITASNKIYDGTTTAALDTSGAALGRRDRHQRRHSRQERSHGQLSPLRTWHRDRRDDCRPHHRRRTGVRLHADPADHHGQYHRGDDDNDGRV